MKKKKFDFESWQGALILVLVYLFFLITGTVGFVIDNNTLSVGLFFSTVMFLTLFNSIPDYFAINRYLTKFLIWLPWFICAGVIACKNCDSLAAITKNVLVVWAALAFSPWLIFIALFLYSGFPSLTFGSSSNNSKINDSNIRENAKQYARNRYLANTATDKVTRDMHNKVADEIMIKSMGGTNEEAKRYALNRYHASTSDTNSSSNMYNKAADEIYGKVINKK